MLQDNQGDENIKVRYLLKCLRFLKMEELDVDNTPFRQRFLRNNKMARGNISSNYSRKAWRQPRGNPADAAAELETGLLRS